VVRGEKPGTAAGREASDDEEDD